MRDKPLSAFQAACAVGMFLWFPAFLLEELLLKAGALNTKFGAESASLNGYLLRADYWDAAVFVLLLFAAPCFVVSLVLVIFQRWRPHEKKA